MGIINSEITENQVQVDGQRRISYRYTFSTGEIIDFAIRRPNSFDVNVGLTAFAATAKERVVEQEDTEYLRAVRDGDVDAINVTPVHPDTDTAFERTKRFRRKALRWIVANDDLKLARRIFYPVWYWLKFESGYTAQQIANYLNISLSVLQRIDNRFQAIHDNLAFLDADDQYVEEVDE